VLKVYLAGPMTGLTLEEAEGWRERAADALTYEKTYYAGFDNPCVARGRFECFSPLRGKEFLRDAGEMTSAGPVQAGGDQGIYTRDRWDVMRADVVLANFTGARTVSIGTMFELAWAAQAGKYTVVVMEPGNPHDHAFVRQAASAVFGKLDEALEYMTKTLCKTGGGT
jgi:nucleoside 2-deoxyribosyltransferase